MSDELAASPGRFRTLSGGAGKTAARFADLDHCAGIIVGAGSSQLFRNHLFQAAISCAVSRLVALRGFSRRQSISETIRRSRSVVRLVSRPRRLWRSDFTSRFYIRRSLTVSAFCRRTAGSSADSRSLLVIEATRRVAGGTLAWLALAVILYTKFAEFLPGIFYSKSPSWARIASYLYLDSNAMLGLAPRRCRRRGRCVYTFRPSALCRRRR